MATDGPLLTEDEFSVLTLTARVANLLSQVVDYGPTRVNDLNELLVYVHNIQHAVMAQAAARAYPERFRLLGQPGPPR